MVQAHLHRIDPEANMARFYCIDIAPTLFGEISVLRNWGRIGTQGRMSFETCATAAEAETASARTLRQKLRRGYGPAFQICGPDLSGQGLSDFALQPAFELSTGLDRDPLMDDVGVDNSTRRKLDISCQDRADHCSEHGEVVGDDRAFNPT